MLITLTIYVNISPFYICIDISLLRSAAKKGEALYSLPLFNVSMYKWFSSCIHSLNFNSLLMFSANLSWISHSYTIIIFWNINYFTYRFLHCRQRAPVGNALSSSGTSQIGIFDIQATTKSKYYIVLLYLESRRCRYRSIIFACFYLYITVVIFIDYSDIDKMMDINNEKC